MLSIFPDDAEGRVEVWTLPKPARSGPRPPPEALHCAAGVSNNAPTQCLRHDMTLEA